MENVRWKISEYGSPEKLVMSREAIEEIEDDKILIKVEFSGINSADLHLRRGKSLLVRLYNGIFRPKRIVALGQDYSGVIIGVGKSVVSLKTGDRVFGLNPDTFGTNTNYILVNKDSLISKVPKAVSMASACASLFGFLNGSFFFKKYIRSADTKEVLVLNSRSVVGGVVKKLATDQGYSVYTEYENLKDDHSARFDVVFDSRGKHLNLDLFKVLKRRGRYISPVFSIKLLLFKLIGSLVRRKFSFDVASVLSKDLEDLTCWLDTSTNSVPIDKVWDFEQLKDAHTYIEKSGKSGACLLKATHTE